MRVKPGVRGENRLQILGVDIVLIGYGDKIRDSQPLELQVVKIIAVEGDLYVRNRVAIATDAERQLS